MEILKDNERMIVFAYSGYYRKYSETKNFQDCISNFGVNFSDKLKDPQDMKKIYAFCRGQLNEAQEMGFKQGVHYKD